MERELPWALTICADEETHLWRVDISADYFIRSYLYTLEAVEVDISRRVWTAEDVLTMTYIFHMRDGSSKSILFQENMVCVDPQQNESDVIYPLARTKASENACAKLVSLDGGWQGYQKVNAEEERRQIIQFAGNTVTLSLVENGRTGYLWSYTVEPGGALVCIGDKYEAAPDSEEADGGGRRRFLQTRA